MELQKNYVFFQSEIFNAFTFQVDTDFLRWFYVISKS